MFIISIHIATMCIIVSITIISIIIIMITIIIIIIPIIMRLGRAIGAHHHLRALLHVHVQAEHPQVAPASYISKAHLRIIRSLQQPTCHNSTKH